MDEIYCKYFKIEEVTGKDIYGHLTYKYYCTKKNKEVFYLMCIRCKDNTIKENNKNDDMQ